MIENINNKVVIRNDVKEKAEELGLKIETVTVEINVLKISNKDTKKFYDYLLLGSNSLYAIGSEEPKEAGIYAKINEFKISDFQNLPKELKEIIKVYIPAFEKDMPKTIYNYYNDYKKYCTEL